MKPLQNHTLIYDNECPMCNIYSKGFIIYGMLDEDGREAFAELSFKTGFQFSYPELDKALQHLLKN